MPALLGFVRRVFDLMDQIGVIDSHDEIRTRIMDVTGDRGISMFAVCRLPQPRLKIASSMMLKKWPEAWLRHYDSQNYYRDDPVATTSMSTVRPFIWSSLGTRTPLKLAEQRVMDEAREIGMSDGFSVPIVDIHGFQAVVSMAGPEVDLDPADAKALHLLALSSFEAAERLAGRAALSSAVLTPRERDVLQYAAEGLSQPETARILRISFETVVSHAKSARIKLGATNTTHAVVKAFRERKIQL